MQMSLDPQNYKPFRDESMRFDEDEDEDILFLASKRKVICGNGSVLHEQSESLNIFPTGKRIKEQHSSDLEVIHRPTTSKIDYGVNEKRNTTIITKQDSDSEILRAQQLLSRITSVKVAIEDVEDEEINQQVNLAENIENIKKYKIQFESNSDNANIKVHEQVLLNSDAQNVTSIPLTESSDVKVKVKTRLNGKDERKWKISRNDIFKKFKEKLSQIYGVPVESIKLILDGDKITDHDTAGTLDIEDDTIIDVKIPEESYANAIDISKSHNHLPNIPMSIVIQKDVSAVDEINVIVRVQASTFIPEEKAAPKIVTKVVMNISIASNMSLADLKMKLVEKSVIKEDDLIEFAIKKEQTLTVIENSNIVRAVGLVTGSEIYALPKRVQITISPENKCSGGKFNLNKSIGLILRQDYTFNSVISTVCNHLKISSESIKFLHRGIIVTDYHKTLFELGIFEGTVIHLRYM